MARTASSLTIMTEELDEEVLDSLAGIEQLYTVFDGASQEDVAYAKVFWNSISLQPPIESRLVSADIRQRLKVAKTPHTTNAAAKQASWSKRHDEIQQDVYLKQKQEERQKYIEMAKKREQIIALLKNQRDERIKIGSKDTFIIICGRGPERSSEAPVKILMKL
ncbi:cilia- and flagella-associated protein HOATZ isoform X3 [Pseudorasbora parva]|uniref:cilia- and flagella-associated protein HOATZ isoform X3 n=1 Tax=Pseudorasbora parva TaxID=51549 RepID=UPI00351EB0D9